MATSLDLRIIANRTVTDEAVSGEIGIYPTSSIDIAKLARASGLTVQFDHEADHRRYQILEAAEFWLPVLQVGAGVLIGIGTNWLSDLIKDWLGSEAEESILHVDYRIVEADGTEKSVQLDGKGEDVLRAIDKFENRYLPGSEDDEE